jgi:hypothetical protein
MIKVGQVRLTESQPSSSSENDRAASQNAKAKHAIPRTFRKLSEMWDFVRWWGGLVSGSSIEINHYEPSRTMSSNGVLLQI